MARRLPVQVVWVRTSVLLCMYLSLCAPIRDKARMTPVRPMVAVGQSLEVQCTTLNQNLTSYNLTFALSNCMASKPVHSTVTWPNSTTAVLAVLNITKNFRLVCCNKISHELLDGVSILAGQKPRPFSITSVVVDNWDTLTIRWSDNKWPEHRLRTYFIPTTTAYWKAGEEADFHVCPKHNETSCRFSLTDQHVDKAIYFTVKVNSINLLGRFSTLPQIVHMANINKPRAVRNMRIQSTGRTWLQVRWKSAAPVGRYLLYAITASCQLIKHPQVPIISEDLIVVQNITSLPSGTHCWITVTARSNEGNVWSDRESIYGTTRDSVPTGFPVTTGGGFDSHYHSDSERDMTLYWQPMPAQFQGGNITGYKIIVTTTGPAGKGPIELPSSMCCRHSIRLAANEMYYISVVARTSAGYNAKPKPQAQVIVQPQAVLHLLHPDNVTAVVTKDNATEVMWSVKKGTVYTGYWCCSRNGKICDGVVKWVRDISAPWTFVSSASTNLHQHADPCRHTDPPKHTDLHRPTDRHLVRFGISSDQGTGSSGITWSDCVYHLTGKSKAPKVFSMAVSSGVSLRLMHDPGDLCSDQNGLIYAYRITYCMLHINHSALAVIVPRTGHTTVWEVDSLKDNTKYRFTIYSLTAAGLSTIPTTVDLTTLQSGVALNDHLAEMIIGGLICLIFLVIGTTCAFRKCGKKYREKLKISILLPEQVAIDAGDAPHHPACAVRQFHKPAVTSRDGDSAITSYMPCPILSTWTPTFTHPAPISPSEKLFNKDRDSGVSSMSDSSSSSWPLAMPNVLNHTTGSSGTSSLMFGTSGMSSSDVDKTRITDILYEQNNMKEDDEDDDYVSTIAIDDVHQPHQPGCIVHQFHIAAVMGKDEDNAITSYTTYPVLPTLTPTVIHPAPISPSENLFNKDSDSGASSMSDSSSSSWPLAMTNVLNHTTESLGTSSLMFLMSGMSSNEVEKTHRMDIALEQKNVEEDDEDDDYASTIAISDGHQPQQPGCIVHQFHKVIAMGKDEDDAVTSYTTYPVLPTLAPTVIHPAPISPSGNLFNKFSDSGALSMSDSSSSGWPLAMPNVMNHTTESSGTSSLMVVISGISSSEVDKTHKTDIVYEQNNVKYDDEDDDYASTIAITDGQQPHYLGCLVHRFHIGTVTSRVEDNAVTSYITYPVHPTWTPPFTQPVLISLSENLFNKDSDCDMPSMSDSSSSGWPLAMPNILNHTTESSGTSSLMFVMSGMSSSEVEKTHRMDVVLEQNNVKGDDKDDDYASTIAITDGHQPQQLDCIVHQFHTAAAMGKDEDNAVISYTMYPIVPTLTPTFIYPAPLSPSENLFNKGSDSGSSSMSDSSSSGWPLEMPNVLNDTTESSGTSSLMFAISGMSSSEVDKTRTIDIVPEQNNVNDDDQSDGYRAMVMFGTL